MQILAEHCSFFAESPGKPCLAEVQDTAENHTRLVENIRSPTILSGDHPLKCPLKHGVGLHSL